MACCPHLGWLGFEQFRQAAVREALALEEAHFVRAQVRELVTAHALLDQYQFLDLRQEPGVDRGLLEHFRHRHADAEGVAEEPDAVRSGLADLLDDLVAIGRVLVQAVGANFEAAQRLLERLLEGAADRHDLAHRLHLRGQVVVGLRELLEREARNLGDDVVDRGLEARRRRPARDLVAQFVERVADGKLGGDLGDREAGRLRRQRRRARHARVHLDHDHAAVAWIDRELHVRAAGIHADLAQDRDARVAHDLVFLVGQCLGRRDGDRVTRVDTHRVEVLDRAHDDAVVRLVADHFHFELFPANQRLLDQQFARR